MPPKPKHTTLNSTQGSGSETVTTTVPVQLSNQNSQQGTVTTTVPTQRKAEDYYHKSAQEIADYFSKIHEHAFAFFNTQDEIQAILEVLSELEPYTTECEWNGIPFETYKDELKERFTTALKNLVVQNTDADPMNIINDFWDENYFSTSSDQGYPQSAQKVYSYSYDNKYEDYRVKAKNETQFPAAMKKLFLRRLSSDRDKIIDQKVRFNNNNKNPNEDPNEAPKKFPRLKISGIPWSPIVNDAFVGGGIDAGARFKISDLSDNTMEKIADLSNPHLSNADLSSGDEKSKLEEDEKSKPENAAESESENAAESASENPAESKLEQFWKICKTDPNLYKKGKQVEPHRYTVLAREIAQLLKKGWIFKTFPRKEGFKQYYQNNKLNLIAFKDENAANEYSQRKMKVRQQQQSAKD